MKKNVLYLFLCFSFAVTAQVTNEGTPASWELSAIEQLESINMPAFDLQRLLDEDAINDKNGKQAWRFGKEFLVNHDLNNSGRWTTLDNGDRIWRIRFQSEGAITMNFIFDDFYLPEGGKIYLYNNDKTALIGAYTHQENNSERMLGTWMIDGDDVWIEYLEPKNVEGKGILQIGKVVHGYRSQSQILGSLNRNLNSSGNCNHDVDCPINPELEDYKDHNKYGVAFMIMSGFVCSGTLINNTTNDGTPYFLTANHCNAGSPASWSFRFKWISPNPVCASTANSTQGPLNFVMSGAVNRANRAQTDFRLLELNNPIPTAWDLVWAGWDRSDDIPTHTFGIHHPSADIMKVCVDDNPPGRLLQNGNQSVWRIYNWELGVTEGGSSGSALFDPEGKIIGQLWRGTAQCQGLNPVGWDEYGRFGISWDQGGNSATQLKDWLDPDDTGVMTLDPNPPMPPMSVAGHDFASAVTVYPNPSNGIINIDNRSGNSVGYEVYNLTGAVVSKGNSDSTLFSLDLSNNTTGVYFIKLTDTQTNTSTTKKLILK